MSKQMRITCEVDLLSASSGASERRKLNSNAARRLRARKRGGLIPLPEDMQVGVLNIQKRPGKHAIHPPNEILVQCQSLFGLEESGYEPHQVFIAMKKMSSPNDGAFQDEFDFLLRIMQLRLCLPGVRDTEEGRFIRLAIAFSRRISVQKIKLPATVKNEAFIVDLRSLFPGTCEMKIHFPNPGHVETVLGNTAKLIEHITYIDPICPPPPKGIY